MQTCKEKTLSALNSQFLDLDSWCITKADLTAKLTKLVEQDGRLWAYMKSPRSKPTSVAWACLTQLANNLLIIIHGEGKYYATSDQLKYWVNRYGEGYDTLRPTAEYIRDLKEETKCQQ